MTLRLIRFLAACLLAASCGDNLTPPPEHASYDAAGAADPWSGYGGGADSQAYDPSQPQPLACVPNLDGQIDPGEIQTAVGVPISYLVSPDGAEREVDVAGVESGGEVFWDWSVDVADDQIAKIEAGSLEGKWYAGSFPDGEFITPVDAGGTVHAVHRRDDDTLWLLGVASAEPDPPQGRTLLVYKEPIAALRFPLIPGLIWTSAGEVENGELFGLPYAGKDTYDVEVDAMGELALPDLTFTQAHRVRTTVTVMPAVGMKTTRQQVSFYFECFGEVARATSLPNETEKDFTTASEVRRLGL